MPLVGSGPISLYDANVELGRPGGQAISMDDGGLRTLAGVGGSGSLWGMNSLYGKSNVTVTISNNAQTLSAGGNNRYTGCTFSVSVTGGSPSSYSWGHDNPNGGQVGGATSSTFVVKGNEYDQLGGTVQSGGTVYLNVVVNGVTYSASLYFEVTVAG